MAAPAATLRAVFQTVYLAAARFIVFELPAAHQRRLPTSKPSNASALELKRCTRVAAIFPNEASLLRLTCAVLAEISDAWLAAKISLDMNSSNPPTA